MSTKPEHRERREENRRVDHWSAERIDLALLTARAFDLHAATNYLTLSGVSPVLVERFSSRYPDKLRGAASRASERRRVRPVVSFDLGQQWRF